jgi:Fe2+ or Zn2+ uptake regulation protein
MKKTRMTNQRMKIIEYLNSVDTHPTAEDIYLEVKKVLPAITLATVYRNLNMMVSEGKALVIKIDNKCRYDGDTSQHQHCVCQRCGKIVDLFQEEINEDALKKIRSKDFEPTKVSIVFTGICRGCMKKRF